MITIKEQAETKLISLLEAMRYQPPAAGIGLTRVIHIRPSAQPETKDIVARNQRIILLTVQNTFASNSQIFICEDGDIFVLAAVITASEARKLIIDLALQLNQPALDTFAAIYELSVHMNKVLVLLEEKIEKHRKEQEELKIKQACQLAAQKRESILHNNFAHNKAQAIAAQRKERGKPEIMIIEDDPFSRRLIQNVLQKHYSLTVLSDAEFALATYAHKAPDVLFLDINLPDVTGHELLEKIIVLDPDAFVVMLSANADRENILRAMSKGAKGFVGKPFSQEKLIKYLELCPTIKH